MTTMTLKEAQTNLGERASEQETARTFPCLASALAIVRSMKADELEAASRRPFRPFIHVADGRLLVTRGLCRPGSQGASVISDQ